MGMSLVTFIIPDEITQKLDKIAKKEEMSSNKMAIKALSEYIDKTDKKQNTLI